MVVARGSSDERLRSSGRDRSRVTRPANDAVIRRSVVLTFAIGGAWLAGAACGFQNRCGAVRLSRAGSIPVRLRRRYFKRGSFEEGLLMKRVLARVLLGSTVALSLVVSAPRCGRGAARSGLWERMPVRVGWRDGGSAVFQVALKKAAVLGDRTLAKMDGAERL